MLSPATGKKRSLSGMRGGVGNGYDASRKNGLFRPSDKWLEWTNPPPIRTTKRTDANTAARYDTISTSVQTVHV